MRVKGTVYRSYSLDVEFDSDEVPEMIDPDGKAEWYSRSIPLDQWTLDDVATETRVFND